MAAIAVLVVVTAAGSGVYAAVRHWGILDFADRTVMDVPEDLMSNWSPTPDMTAQ